MIDHQTRTAIRAAVLVTAVALVLPTTAQAQTTGAPPDSGHLDAYHAMQDVTLGLMGATLTLGSIQLYNMPTIFSDGGCLRQKAAFGAFACEHRLTLVHAGMGALSLGSYIATEILSADLPTRNRSATESTISDVLTVATAIGYGVTAIIGLIAANLGDFDVQKVLRVIHAGIALLTVGAFATQVGMEHIR